MPLHVSLDATFFAPPGHGRVPAILLAHGFGETKDAVRPEAEQLARAGFAVLTWSARERECLLLLVEGLDTAGIAAKLGVSAATVRTHVQSLMTKLGVHSRLEAASYAVRYRLLDDEESHFRSTGTGLARRHTTRAAVARPAAAATASTVTTVICRATLGGVAAKL